MLQSSVQAHASLMGSSSCERVIKCPASPRLIAVSPSQPVSDAALDGTAQHAVAEHILLHGGNPADFIDSETAGRKIDAEMAANVGHALLSVDELLTDFDGEQFVELRVERDPVEVFGTGDFVAFNKAHTKMLSADHKFGYVEVEADNYQGKFICATMLVDPEYESLMRDVETFRVAVIQPSFEPAHTWVDISREEIEQFNQTIELAITTAKSPDAPTNIGKWCTYCPAKIICPAWKRRTEDLIDMMKHPDWSPAGVSRILHIGKEFNKLYEDAKERAKHELENGRKIPPVDGKPGWRLKNGRTMQDWTLSVKDTIASLRGFNLQLKQVQDVISPAQVKKLLPKSEHEALDKIITKSTSAPSLALDSDEGAPAVPAAAFARAAQTAAFGGNRKK